MKLVDLAACVGYFLILCYFSSQSLPFGGVKGSGYGRFGIAFFCHYYLPLLMPL